MSSGLLPPVPNSWGGGYINRTLMTNIRPNDPPPVNNEAYMLFNVDWSIFQAQNKQPCYLFQTGQSTNPLKQIAAVYVDNQLCNQDLFIQFLDTQFTLRIHAGAAPQVYPVITNGLDFFAWLDNTPASDSIIAPPAYTPYGNTKIFILNANVPPIVGSTQELENIMTVHATGSGTFTPFDNTLLNKPLTVLITAIKLIQTNLIANAGGSNYRWSLILNKYNGGGNQINYFVGNFATQTGIAYFLPLVDDQNVNMLCTGVELDITLTGGTAAPNFDCWLGIRYKNLMPN